MRRAERLFQLIQLVRGRRLSTARWLAERMQVSERTVYRDVAELQLQGVPIEGEAGVGYRMRAGFELPPLMFRGRSVGAGGGGALCAVEVLEQHFFPELGKTLADFLRQLQDEHALDEHAEDESARQEGRG